MNCTCKVEQRRLTPGVFNLKQFLNGSETMIWTLDNCMTNEGTCDLKNYDAFLVLSVGGEIDEIMLTKRQNGDTLQLIWNVGTYATALSGYVKYQLVFRSATFDTLGVIAEDPEVNGVYALTDQDMTGNDRIFQKYENGYQIKWDDANGCWSLYRTDGVSVIDSQTTPSTEPHCGAWGEIAVGNNEAAVWVSDEAIMYVSDSIAADQAVTAGFPTILRQLWARLQKSGVTSVNGKSGIVELFPEDIGAADDEHGHEIEEISGLIDALAGKTDTGHGHAMADVAGLIAALNGKTDTGHGHEIANVNGLQTALDGKAPTEHGHTIGNVTGLQDALDGKLPADAIVTAGNAGPTANASPGYGGTFAVPYFTFDAHGRITGTANRTITMPSATAYISAASVTATRGYIKFSNKLLIQWGYATYTGATQARTLTFPTAFANTTYTFLRTSGSQSTTTGDVNGYQGEQGSRTTTAISIYTTKNAGNYNWIAIGTCS